MVLRESVLQAPVWGEHFIPFPLHFFILLLPPLLSLETLRYGIWCWQFLFISKEFAFGVHQDVLCFASSHRRSRIWSLQMEVTSSWVLWLSSLEEPFPPMPRLFPLQETLSSSPQPLTLTSSPTCYKYKHNWWFFHLWPSKGWLSYVECWLAFTYLWTSESRSFDL